MESYDFNFYSSENVPPAAAPEAETIPVDVADSQIQNKQILAVITALHDQVSSLKQFIQKNGIVSGGEAVPGHSIPGNRSRHATLKKIHGPTISAKRRRGTNDTRSKWTQFKPRENRKIIRFLQCVNTTEIGDNKRVWRQMKQEIFKKSKHTSLSLACHFRKFIKPNLEKYLSGKELEEFEALVGIRNQSN